MSAVRGVSSGYIVILGQHRQSKKANTTIIMDTEDIILFPAYISMQHCNV